MRPAQAFEGMRTSRRGKIIDATHKFLGGD
jgi:hypothetical protein